MEKYPRTYHVPFSPGIMRDDKVLPSLDNLLGREVILTEKVDGSNVRLSRAGYNGRSVDNGLPHASFDAFKQVFSIVQCRLLANVSLFGEWCWAEHSLHYHALPTPLLLFAAYDAQSHLWMPWKSVEEYATSLSLATVPVLDRGVFRSEAALRERIEALMRQPSEFDARDIVTQEPTREGIVIRQAEGFAESAFSVSVAKYVRPHHVKTSEHWREKPIVRNGLKHSLFLTE